MPGASVVRSTLTAAVCVAGMVAGAAPGALAAPAAPSPGAQGLGDSLFPALGNGGYDALSYDFALAFGTESTSPVSGTVTMVATATQALSSFSLDYAGSGSGPVLVNGAPSTVASTGEKLVITPKRALPAGRAFVVSLTGFVTAPGLYDPDDPASTDFFAAPSGTVVAAQPNFAHYAFPVNDHPLDKALYTFRLTAPTSETAVANGALVGKSTRNGATTWTYLQRQPMAAELIQLAVGDYDVIERKPSAGVKLRDVVARPVRDRVEPAISEVGRQMKWVTNQLGAYPFDVYGSLVTDEPVGFALETQTLSMYGPDWFYDDEGDLPAPYWAPTMVHELAHQWFGDSVSPSDWADIWINEGHATWYEALFAQSEDDATPGYFDEYIGLASFDEMAEVIYNLGDRYRDRFGPVGTPASGAVEDVFSPNSYYGGFLVLYALRQEIGKVAFEKLERTYVSRYKGQTRSTADFVALASQIARRDLKPFMDAWLYSATTPPMPGQPDWQVLPVVPAAVARGVAAPDPLPVPTRR